MYFFSLVTQGFLFEESRRIFSHSLRYHINPAVFYVPREKNQGHNTLGNISSFGISDTRVSGTLQN